MSTGAPTTVTFTRIDGNTWQAITGPAGSCATTLITTLQRTGVWWNYRQVRNIAKTEKTDACAGWPPVSTIEFSQDRGQRIWRLGCNIVTLL